MAPKARAIIALAALAVVSAAYVSFRLVGSVPVPGEFRAFTVSPGTPVKEISAQLAERGIIRSDFWFRTLVWLKQKQSRFLAGTFDLPERVSPSGLITLFTSGARQDVRTIIILEGWGIGDIAAYLEREGLFPQGEFLRLTGVPGAFGSADNNFYNELVGRHQPLVYRAAAAPLEGYLFPDTYEVYADAAPRDVIEKMVAHFDAEFTADLREEIVRQGKNFYSVLIMASIIEAEVPHESDRAIVSDIFWSRLESGVALQSDATLNYIIGGDSPALTLEQLEIDSAYNTYKYRGLPPTPIGNPGASAIQAAIYPAKTDYFYFLSTPEGETIFSRTLREHNAAKARHLRQP
ncbi:MAG: endolytic transglycosylase MltG [Parcubacteria group bacterium]|nr:endolytic transglycosylase MltG [Parcubacteria group bacterium]